MAAVAREQVIAFRLARHGLAGPRSLTIGAAAACPASDFQRDAALLALVARCDGVGRERYDAAVDAGEEIAVAPSLRGALHALSPGDLELFGAALVADADDELAAQLGAQVRGQLAEAALGPVEVLAEVAQAVAEALGEHEPLTKDGLHEELRRRLRAQLLPWCPGCRSHHVAPMLWRYALVKVGARCDSGRRYMLRAAAAPGPRAPAEAVRVFLRFYGPADQRGFAAWAGLAPSHARRLWVALEDELAEVQAGGRLRWILAADAAGLASPPQPSGVRLLPPRDPYLQHPDREDVVPEADVRKRLFRPVAGPGAVLQDGRLAGLWRVRGRGRRAEVQVEALADLRRDDLEAEAQRVARARGAHGGRLEVL